MDAEIWVVDNASTDGSVDFLISKYPTVHFIANEVNNGFGKANNQALEKCKGTYILFLNPDTILPEDCLIKSIGIMESKKKVGALGIRMIDGSGKFLPESKRSFPTAMTAFYKLSGLSKIFSSSRIFSRYSLANLDQNKSYEVDVLAGAFILGRREMLVSLKGFDEAFFMYGEDIDLSYRIQKAGYKNYYFGGSTIIHFKGESTTKDSLNYVKTFYQAMSIFVNKHYTGTNARFSAFFIHRAIWLKAAFTAMQKFIGIGEFKKKEIDIKVKQIAIVGTQEEFNEAKNLMKSSDAQVNIKGRIAVSEDINNSLGRIPDLPRIIRKNGINEIVFCQGFVGYKSIIKMIQNMPVGVSARFYGQGTSSIVGSDSKNSMGEFVAHN